MLDNGADITSCYTARHFGENRQSLLYKAVNNLDVEVVRELIRRGLDVNLGFSALSFVCNMSREEHKAHKTCKFHGLDDVPDACQCHSRRQYELTKSHPDWWECQLCPPGRNTCNDDSRNTIRRLLLDAGANPNPPHYSNRLGSIRLLNDVICLYDVSDSVVWDGVIRDLVTAGADIRTAESLKATENFVGRTVKVSRGYTPLQFYEFRVKPPHWSATMAALLTCTAPLERSIPTESSTVIQEEDNAFICFDEEDFDEEDVDLSILSVEEEEEAFFCSEELEEFF